ncbi:MAG: HD domain-containing phosphohydrolase [Candidatus Omnitrophota bacterium]
MYEAYWGLTEKPFRNSPDPKFLYYSPQHKDALLKLTYCAQEMLGAAMLTGIFGCGKTVIANALLKELNPEKFRVAFITHPRSTSAENLVNIGMSLGDKDLIHKSGASSFAESLALESIKNILYNNHDDGKNTIVIIDEAHIIDDPKIFEQLRMLLNFQLMDKFLLTLILVGQSDLRQKIDGIKQFEQRIAVKSHLDALNYDETKNYIDHRLAVAGRKEPIFTPEAVSVIYESSGGIPRRINRICELSLLTGFTHKATIIDVGIIQAQTSTLGVEITRHGQDKKISTPRQEEIAKQPLKAQGNEKEAEQFYHNGLVLAENIFNRAEKDELLDYKAVDLFIEQLIEALKKDDRNLIKLANKDNEQAYLYCHILNVTILSLIVGIKLGFDLQELTDLGRGTFLHDIGFVRFKGIILKSAILLQHEHEELKKHPVYSKQILEQAKFLPEIVRSIAFSHHERLDGSGYPEGLKADQLQDSVKIVSVCDAFEEMTHLRPWKEAVSPYEAMKVIKNETVRLFDPNIVKALVEKISVYPIGSLVKLNNQEIAEVVDVESGFPRFLNILYSPSGSKLEKGRPVDLFDYPNLYIESATAASGARLNTASNEDKVHKENN